MEYTIKVYRKSALKPVPYPFVAYPFLIFVNSTKQQMHARNLQSSGFTNMNPLDNTDFFLAN